MKELLIERNRYFDSVFLMRISSELEELEGITQAVVAMATPINVENLIKSGFELSTGDAAPQPADLIIAIDALSSDANVAARARLDELLTGGSDTSPRAQASRPSSLGAALAADPGINLALISVPGIHAAREASQALQRGLHVMLFSDNVRVEDEAALKDDAIDRGLLMMGPDCGTAILNGAALGFANVCRRGNIGIVGASGTGIQEISSLVHQLGGGISQAIGTGGRDLSEAIDGRMTRFGIQALGQDPATDVIVVVSKTPSPGVADKVIQTLTATEKPAVVHFIGGVAQRISSNLEATATLADAAHAAVTKAGIEMEESNRHADRSASSGTQVAFSATAEKAKQLAPKASTEISGEAGISQRAPAGARVAGFFCGGTLCQETWNILDQAGLDVRSNVASDRAKKIHPGEQAAGHVVWDLGDDAFTVGKPHPMIEPRLRDDHVASAGEDPSIGIIMADCVIGYGAHDNPAASLGEAAIRALSAARSDSRQLVIVASVTGTDQDPQNLQHQRQILEAAGINVASSNAAAAQLVANLMEGGAR